MPKNLTINPLKKSAVLGATLPFLGLCKAIPIHHGSMGCTAFIKNMLTQHFREITPMQTTAVYNISAIMGDDANLIEGLKTLIGKTSPEIVGLITTGLTQMRGDDVSLGIKNFRKKYSEFSSTTIIPVNVSDFAGDAETGYRDALSAIIDSLNWRLTEKKNRKKIAIFCGMNLTSGDKIEIKRVISMFGLKPILLPDISASLGSGIDHYYKVSDGGPNLHKIKSLNTASFAIGIGYSITEPCKNFAEKNNIGYEIFDSITGVKTTDKFIQTLSEISGAKVPEILKTERNQLIDAMLDSHFYLGDKYISIAAEPDLLYQLSSFITDELGIKINAAIASVKSDILNKISASNCTVGDLMDLEELSDNSDLIITNSNGIIASERLQIPLYKIGYPIKDMLGHHMRSFSCYNGTRNFVYDIGNIFLEQDEHKSYKYKHYKGVTI